MPDDMGVSDGCPVVWTAMGRQRVGKTTILSAAVQYYRGHGSRIEVWNADQQNRSNSLSTFVPDALTPPIGTLVEARLWIEQRLAHQTEHRYHAVLDAGGGVTGFSSLLEEIPIFELLRDRGTEVVGLFCLGPEQADLDFLYHLSASGLLLPKAMVLVLNSDLVLSGRSIAGAFAGIRENPTFKSVVEAGAHVVTMPALSCMSEVTDRGITFEQAARGEVKPGQKPMSLFDPLRVNEWWTKKIPAFFSRIPPQWQLLSSNSICPNEASSREPS